jgi:hypothetical protein
LTAEIILADEQPREIAPAVESGTLWGSSDPLVVIEKATAMSKAIMEVVKTQRLSVQIGPRKHLLIEAWTLMGSMVGISPVVIWTRPIKEDGVTVAWEARVEAVTRSGAVVSAAEAMCARSEKQWKDRDEFALRSMAQTRATSKALATCLRFIAVLAGFAGTPAEEMPRDATAAPQSASTARWAERPKTGESSLCAACVREGFMSTTGAPPTFRKSKRGDYQCNGRTAEVGTTGDYGWANHPMPLEPGKEIHDDTSIPF